ncbi:pheromone-binding protein-related protein 6-like isoform X2 [Anoplophora glabripennis]|uniref:pheromone-binding protein-related protein 6-like isoform X2 n=1 Tax=Anoplophora glabripennis TaxID=217634 RepID=UPI000C77134D|nr:pheromone-binding protein-related protein 6-like isoform X2 [Anoplophora glabripennis]
MDSSLFFILVCSLLAVSEVQATVAIADLGPKIKQLVETLHSVCIPRSGTSEEAIQKVINGEFTDEPKIKAYMRCLLEESGVVDENLAFNNDVAAALIPPKLLNDVLENIKICEPKKAGGAPELAHPGSRRCFHFINIWRGRLVLRKKCKQVSRVSTIKHLFS